MTDVLRLRARDDGHVYPHLQREAAKCRSFIGYEYKVVAKGPSEDGSLDAWGFVPTGEVVELPVDEFTRDYAIACAEGDLIAADAETAAICRKFTGRAVPHAGASTPKPSSKEPVTKPKG